MSVYINLLQAFVIIRDRLFFTWYNNIGNIDHLYVFLAISQGRVDVVQPLQNNSISTGCSVFGPQFESNVIC